MGVGRREATHVLVDLLGDYCVDFECEPSTGVRPRIARCRGRAGPDTNQGLAVVASLQFSTKSERYVAG